MKVSHNPENERFGPNDSGYLEKRMIVNVYLNEPIPSHILLGVMFLGYEIIA
jgi:hypothetical protein